MTYQRFQSLSGLPLGGCGFPEFCAFHLLPSPLPTLNKLCVDQRPQQVSYRGEINTWSFFGLLTQDVPLLSLCIYCRWG